MRLSLWMGARGVALAASPVLDLTDRDFARGHGESLPPFPRRAWLAARCVPRGAAGVPTIRGVMEERWCVRA